MVTVTTAARLHFGFQNLALANERLYGGVGAALDRPALELSASPAEAVVCDDAAAEPYVRRAVAVLGVEGARVAVRQRMPRHVGFGSGTQLALAALVAVARAHDREVDPRELAPDLGRGGRSGVGVATFESGGFVVDGGHPTERFTAEPPAEGDWTVPPVIARHDLPEDWRFVLVVPEVDQGVSGREEDRRMRETVERADPGIADDVAAVLTRRLLPAAATGDAMRFGDAAAAIGRLNGAWYADEQGGVYRPPAGRIVERLARRPEIAGAGQSSWGPAVWGLTTRADVDAAETGVEMALSDLAVDADVLVAAPRDEGATVADGPTLG
ncbi:beta-ribofuranosylaminobenzene 5'-phosphate synthase family protein [Halomicrobium urmianum]|uniref:beta-ribofuranosylaminobenzene 5'-phosphate synthase family protein n=1 Tax=Halomicrobium urmianum TaxID=1586233 RepID=UPI001CD998EA|nr:beta-ribofuranosylaminobenzene 5'-phosphate synthase family protein [Halomicrobium urmianum]